MNLTSRFLAPAPSAAVNVGLGAGGFVLVVTLWWLATRLGVLDANVFPPPSVIWDQVREDGVAFYGSAAAVTGGTALRGFAAGTATALLAAAVVELVPRTRTAVTQVAVVAQCVPSMAFGPVLMLLFGGRVPGVVIGAITVHFVVLVATLGGLRSASRTQVDLVRACGGDRWSQLVHVRAIAALPSFLTSLQVAVPCAVIGALLGEYLGGVDSGIGVAMAVAQGVYEKTRTWSLGLLTVLLTLTGNGVVALVRRVANRRLT